ITMQSTPYGGQAFGEAGDDSIVAADNNNRISGGAGADTINGSAASDYPVSGDALSTNSMIPADDLGPQPRQISAGGGGRTLAAGYGDDVDGGGGTDTLSLSLGGLTHGLTADLSTIISAQPFTLGGGVIQNVESLVYLRGSDFADQIILPTQGVMVTMNAGS